MSKASHEYEWKEGYRANVPAQVAGERLDTLRRQAGGALTPGEVVEDARPDDATLHPCFEWCDPVAAEAYRREQARQLIRSVRVLVQTHDDQPPQPVLAYVRVHEEDGEGASQSKYVTTQHAVSTPHLRQQVVEEALGALDAWRKRYNHLQELGDIFAAVTRVAARLRARPKVQPPAKAQPRQVTG